MANMGTSPRIPIGGEKFIQIRRMKLSPVYNEGATASPPVPLSDDIPSEAMYRFQNKYKDFAFQKICPPDYGPSGALARVTGAPANTPDFIADFHFISIMRIIDQILDHKDNYTKSYIGGGFNTPGPA